MQPQRGTPFKCDLGANHQEVLGTRIWFECGTVSKSTPGEKNSEESQHGNEQTDKRALGADGKSNVLPTVFKSRPSRRHSVFLFSTRLDSSPVPEAERQETCRAKNSDESLLILFFIYKHKHNAYLQLKNPSCTELQL